MTETETETETPQEVWYGYWPKFSLKYFLPFNLVVMSLNSRGSDGWNPDAGTGYPYSGQVFVYSPTAENTDPSGLSGVANVPLAVDTSPSNSSVYVFVSGTVNPFLTSSWYQWQSGSSLVAGVPNNQVGGINVSGNSLYKLIPNQNMAPIQNSGSANVPTSESSTGH